jgi:hypothetical protein
MTIAENETEASLFNRELYEAFKVNPEVCSTPTSPFVAGMCFRLTGSASERDKATEMGNTVLHYGQISGKRQGCSNGRARKNENEGMRSGRKCRIRSLIRTLNPRFPLVLIHSIVDRPLSLPRVGGFKFYLFQGDRLGELLHRVPRWQDGLEMVNLVLVKGIGELDAKFDVEDTGFVVSLRGHTLAVDDF